MERGGGVAVEAEVHVRALAVDHVDLGEARELALAEDVLDELLGGERVRVRLLLRRGERAELALHAADVRLVDVQVLDEEDLVRAAAQPPCRVRELAEREQVVRLEQREPVLEPEPLPGLHLLADRLQGAQFGDGHDYRSRSMTMCVRASRSGSSRRSSLAFLA